MPHSRAPLTPERIRKLAAYNVRCCERIVANAKEQHAGWQEEDRELGPEHSAYLVALDHWLEGVRKCYSRYATT